MRALRITSLVLLIGGFLLEGKSQGFETIFGSEEVLRIRLETAMDPLLSDRSDTTDYQGATIRFEQGGKKITRKALVKIRGNFRRDPNNCAFPPIRLKIPKKEAKGTLFQGHTKFKLVTHCQLETYVLKEYLLYKLYQRLSPWSYQVRLAKITYRDSEKGVPTETAFAFFIEDEKPISERMKAKEIKSDAWEDPQISRKNLVKVATFEYMIGNLDWGVYKRKNLKIFQPEKGGPGFVTPYDFDFSGVVNASYTGIPQGFNRRKLRPLCYQPEETRAVRHEFLSQEKAFEDIVLNCRHLSKKARQEMWAYLSGFLEVLRDETATLALYEAACEY
ncbi:MAG: hypothetical protein AAFR61_15455 [Bacteroidota bacterium]